VRTSSAYQTRRVTNTYTDTPAYAYYQSLWPTELNWAFTTTPQANANNSQLPWPRGKVLGGSSAINGLYLNRPGEIEVNAWQDMLGNMDGADNWSWDSLFAAMKKSETFSAPVSAAIQQEADITFNAASHGTHGPIHMSYPGYTFPEVGAWSVATSSVGVADTSDPYGGENWGAYVATSAINPANWTRSYSRSGYLDPLPPRANYDVLANAYVTRLLFNTSSPQGNLSASGVEYVLNGGTQRLSVGVKKEVILAGGSVGSPAVLLYSGVGPQDVLDAAGVAVVSELPGVGQHLQDHLVGVHMRATCRQRLTLTERLNQLEHRHRDRRQHLQQQW
jgi:choline dehydrogenase